MPKTRKWHVSGARNHITVNNGAKGLIHRQQIARRIRMYAGVKVKRCPTLGEIDESPARAVCLVDDEHDITLAIKKGLEHVGFVVRDFNDPIRAVEAFTIDSKDCFAVISDIRMPSMNGFELARKIKEKRSDVKVILMSAFEINNSEFDKVMPHTKVDGFIKKPFKVAQLVDILKAIS